MKSFVNKIKLTSLLLILVTAVISDVAYCEDPTWLPTHNDQCFTQDIRQILASNKTIVDPSQRLLNISNFFLGKRYLLGALGEGEQGRYDQTPLFRTDAFDCVTFVSTVLALAKSDSYKEFLNHLTKITYKKGVVSYFNRHHFMESDWNRENEHDGYIKNITSKFLPKCNYAYVNIDKPAWYTHHTALNIKRITVSVIETNLLLAELHSHAHQEKSCQVVTDYISLNQLFRYEGDRLEENSEIFRQIPDGAIVEIVDKNRNFKDLIGTDINIVHLGFVFWLDHSLIFRHASKVHHVVIDVPLAQYLKRCYQLAHDPNLVGIHVEQVL